MHTPASFVRRASGLLAGAALLVAAPAGAQEPITLERAVAMAHQRGARAQAASDTRAAARYRTQAFQSRMLPQLGLAGNVPSYNRSIIPVLQPDGTTLFRPQQETSSEVNMLLTQRLLATGGTVTVSSRLAQVRRSGTQSVETWNSTPFSITVSQPILRPNTLSWDNQAQHIQADMAERQFLEQREEISQATADAFFDLYAAQVTLRNAGFNAAINDTVFRVNQGRYEVGRISEADLLQSELALLRSRTALDGARLAHDRAVAALRLALGMAPNAPLEIAVSDVVPDIEVDTARAVAEALRRRARLAELELQEVQAERRVVEARLNNGIGAMASASYGYNATAPEMSLAYRDLQQAQRFTLNLQVPLVQWRARSADVQAAQHERSRAQALARQSRDEVAQEAHFAALQLGMARRHLDLAAKADTVAAKRFEVAYNRYVIGRTGVETLFLAQGEKDQALLAYVQALRGYWTAYFQLRRLTMYDFEEQREIR